MVFRIPQRLSFQCECGWETSENDCFTDSIQKQKTRPTAKYLAGEASWWRIRPPNPSPPVAICAIAARCASRKQETRPRPRKGVESVLSPHRHKCTQAAGGQSRGGAGVGPEVLFLVSEECNVQPEELTGEVVLKMM